MRTRNDIQLKPNLIVAHLNLLEGLWMIFFEKVTEMKYLEEKKVVAYWLSLETGEIGESSCPLWNQNWTEDI